MLLSRHARRTTASWPPQHTTRSSPSNVTCASRSSATCDPRRSISARSHWPGCATALDCELLEATDETLEVWYESLALTPQGRATELGHVRGFYRYAHREGLIDADPTFRLIRPRLPRLLPRPIGDEQLVEALDNATGRVRAYLYLAAFAGLRAAEIAALHREDVVDIAEPPTIIVADGKGGKQRVVPMSDRVSEALDIYGMPTRGWLFPRRDGRRGPTPAYLVSRHSNEHLHRLGIGQTLHTLRHWFGTELYRQTQDLRLVQEVMGHASPNTTAGYAAFAPAKAAVGVRQLEVPR